ncbi:MAG: hypothetical protein LUD39_04065 [Opitutae bacterium]|nr:hypothetical protein [Opitutae bacterium]
MAATILDLSDFSDTEFSELRAAYKSAVLEGKTVTSYNVNGASVAKTITVSTEVLGRSIRAEMRIRGLIPEGREGVSVREAPASYVGWGFAR